MHILALQDVDWMNAVFVAMIIGILVGGPLAIFTGLVTAEIIEFRALIRRGVNYMSDATGPVEFYDNLDLPVIWPSKLTHNEIADQRYRLVQAFHNMDQGGAAGEFIEAYDRYFSHIEIHGIHFKIADNDFDGEDYRNALAAAHAAGKFLIAAGEVQPNYFTIFLRPMRTIGKAIDRGFHPPDEMEWPKRKEH